MKPWTLPAFIVIATLAPVGLLIRYAILTPLSLVVPGLRKTVVERYSALANNPRFRRRAPAGEAKRLWHRPEAAASVGANALTALVLTGVIPLPAVEIVLANTLVGPLLHSNHTFVARYW